MMQYMKWMVEKKQPINHGATSEETFIYDVAKIVDKCFVKVDPNNLNFNLMALTKL